MEHTSHANELDDVVELLTMLEQLLEGRACAGRPISLRGMQLTLAEAKRRLLSARRSLVNTSNHTLRQAQERGAKERANAMALAARITKAPTPRAGSVATPKGRVRELKGSIDAYENTRMFSFTVPADPELEELVEEKVERLFNPARG